MAACSAVLDACVLYPAPLRDLLLQLSLAGLFRARWTEAIHDEWMNALLEKRPDLSRDQLCHTRDLMNAAGLDCLVAGYEHRVAALRLPDPNDRHVLAAAIHCGATVIVTCNRRDFPRSCIGEFGVEARHPDEFIEDLLEGDPERFVNAVRRLRARLRNPAMSVDEYLNVLERQSLPATVSALAAHRHSI